MGSQERSKKKVQLWKKAIVHFSLCFVMGFFSGFAPTLTGKASIFFGYNIFETNRSEFSPQPIEMLHQARTESGNFNRSMMDDHGHDHETPVAVPTRSNEMDHPKTVEEEKEELELISRRLIIIITPTSSKDHHHHLQEVLLMRLANTLKLVHPPLLWVVVEAQSGSSELSEMLRKTGIMYRHLVFKENFTDPEVEMDHQRNVALKHIEQHKLSGIVHFAGLSNVYDLSFFDEIRAIEAFGTWPMALLSANGKWVIIEGPVCDSSEVIGWHLRKMNNRTDTRSPVHISSFAFNSSILWDPERWGRPSSVQDASQNSIKYVKKEVLEEEAKLQGIPAEDCSKIMLWHLNFPKGKTENGHLLETSTENGQR